MKGNQKESLFELEHIHYIANYVIADILHRCVVVVVGRYQQKSTQLCCMVSLLKAKEEREKSERYRGRREKGESESAAREERSENWRKARKCSIFCFRMMED